MRPAPTTPGVQGRGVKPKGSGPNGGLSPADIQSAYQLPTATAGLHSVIGIVDPYDYVGVGYDLPFYRSTFGLPPMDCAVGHPCEYRLNQNGVDLSVTPGAAPPNGYQIDPSWGVETTLDLEAASAACPLCDIVLVEANDTSDTSIYASVDAARNFGATTISLSLGEREFKQETQFDSHLNHPGVAVLVAGGDDGYANANPGLPPGSGYPASSPYVISVGGTRLSQTGGTWSESVWTGTGSGCALYEPKPAWQSGGVCLTRTTNDIAAVGDPATGLAIYDGGWEVVGGTSLSAPLMAGMMELGGGPGQVTGAQGLYSLPTTSLNDVTTGADGAPNSIGADGTRCIGAALYLCTARAGYDGPTGVGTPKGAPAAYAPPTDAASPPGLNFVSQPAFTRSTAQRATLTNTGTFNLHPGLPNISGASASQFSYATNCYGAVVAPGSTCIADVSFTPQQSGLLAAQLNFPSDASSGIQSVTLSGTGGPAPFSALDQGLNTGPVNALASTPPLPGAPSWGFNIGRDTVATGTGGGYVLDGYGGVTAIGNATPVHATEYYPGWDIARAIALDPNTKNSGYVLDAFGGLHPFGGAPRADIRDYYPGRDIARDIALRPDGHSGYILDGFGGLHPFGIPGDMPPDLQSSAYWSGWDIAHRMALDPDGLGGQVVDGYGGLHPFGNAPYIQGAPYFGWDIARDVAVFPGQPGAGYILDGYGGIHPFGGAVLPANVPYYFGHDVVKFLAIA